MNHSTYQEALLICYLLQQHHVAYNRLSNSSIASRANRFLVHTKVMDQQFPNATDPLGLTINKKIHHMIQIWVFFTQLLSLGSM